MTTDEIKARIKQAIAKVSKIDPAGIGDRALFREELGLDSLSVLEALVEIQCRFRLPDLPPEEFPQVQTVEEAARFVEQYLPVAAA
jgi:acyl carrier protein